MRLDQALVARGVVETRSRARDLILRRKVMVAGLVVDKPSQMVGPDDPIAMDADVTHYVSRGAEKLIAGLAAFGFEPVGRVALDVGSSTGGFCEVLLQRGAARVYAVDVGRDQLHPRLRADARVVVHEATDARLLTTLQVPEPIAAVTADVSFISLTKALPAALQLAASGCWCVALIKPQFEAGRAAVGKGGIVKDEQAKQRVLDEVKAWFSDTMGWRVVGLAPSPILGGDGNQEFLIGAVKS
jgi:23S rRNA (cytidine1920-2'-O)/16S rRNA (cytidine1409-2'-O)-methyltransferase